MYVIHEFRTISEHEINAWATLVLRKVPLEEDGKNTAADISHLRYE